MKTAIVYFSKHHGNTKKLVDAIAAAHEVTLINAADGAGVSLKEFDRIGLASGIYAGSFGKPLIAFAERELPAGKPVFFISTSASPSGKAYLKSIRRVTESKSCKELGAYHCTGFNTFGPFKLVGGTAKGHPTEEEIQAAVRFYENL